MDAASVIGCLLGTTVGDALGLPFEGLPPRRAARLFPDRSRYHLFFGRGMVSDDTEHACMAAQALIASGGDPDRFARELARRLRWWFAALPAGVGMATARAGIKLWMGFGPGRSGVNSAGNGPAMRAPIIGVAARDLQHLRSLVPASTLVTHTDPRTLRGALAVALAARTSAEANGPDPDAYRGTLERLVEGDAPTLALADQAIAAARAGLSTPEFARELGLARGVSGFIDHTFPVCLHAWLSSPRDLPAAIDAVIACGGDTDTTAAIVGGIVGAGVGEVGIPASLLAKLAERPRTVAWMRALGRRLAENTPGPPPRLPATGILARNALFLAVVLAHGVRRALPPY